MTDYCEGCYTRCVSIKYGNIDCTNVQLNMNGECPCSQCIIKIMCNQACAEFTYYYEERE